MSKGMDVSIRWNDSKGNIINRRVLRDGKTVLFMASQWHRLFTPFVPMDTGFLALDSVSIFADGSVGKIHHRAPYAAVTYRGRGRRFSTTKHRMASAEWDQAAIRAGRYKILVRDVQNYVKRGR